MSELPHDWSTVSLREIATLVTDGDHNPPKRVAEGIPHLTARNIRDGRFMLDDCTFISSEDFQRTSRRYAPTAGDVIVTCVGTLGQTAIVPEGLSFSADRNLAAIRPRDVILSTFLKAMLDSPQLQNELRSGSGSTAQPHLYLGKLRELRVPLPPLSEQQRIIAAIEEQFSHLDVGIKALIRVREGVRNLKSAAFSLNSKEINSWITLGEIAEVVSGVAKDTKKQADSSFPEIPYLRVANVQRGYLDLAKIMTIRVPTTVAQRLRLKHGDILFSEGGDRDKLGRGWIWEGQVPNSIHQNHVFRARLLNDDYEPKFISMHGNYFGRLWFERNGKQTTNLASLNLSTLKLFPVPKISIGDQRAIVDETELKQSILDALEESIDVAYRQSRRLRSAILSAASLGKLT